VRDGQRGGGEYLATWIKSLRTTNPNTITVGAGDLIGASPLISGLFHDEPTIEAMNALGLDVTGVGNHEFDEGIDELLRMQFGNQLGGDGCHPVDGCQDGHAVRRLALPVPRRERVLRGRPDTIFPPYEIHKIDNVKIAFIGLTLEGTPLIVTPAGVAGLEFRPEVPTINDLVAKLRAEQGVRAFVVLIHQGGFQNGPFPLGYQDSDRCDNFGGDIVPIVNGLSSDVDVVVSAHTHQPTSAGSTASSSRARPSFGRLVTDIDLQISRQTKDIVSATAHNVIVTRDVPPDPAQTQIINKYNALSGPIANRDRGLAVGGHDEDEQRGGRVGARRRHRRRSAGFDLADRLRRRGRRLHEPGRNPGRPPLQPALQRCKPGACHLQPALHGAAVQQRHDREDDDRRQ
jgi:5'-nucleotidase